MADKQYAMECLISYRTECCFPLRKIAVSTQLKNDLGLTGDDDWEFVVAFAQRLSVDMEAFDFNKHFHPEGRSLIWSIFPQDWLKGGYRPTAVDGTWAQ